MTRLLSIPRWAGVVAGLVIAPQLAASRAVRMTGSTPAAETIIQGDHAEYIVRFDGPVNHVASRLEISQDGHVVRTLTPLADSAVDVLFAAGPVPGPGRYGLHWTAVSADGETSSGEIPFTVRQ